MTYLAHIQDDHILNLQCKEGARYVVFFLFKNIKTYLLTEVGALFLLGKEGRILIFSPATSNTKPSTVDGPPCYSLDAFLV